MEQKLDSRGMKKIPWKGRVLGGGHLEKLHEKVVFELSLTEIHGMLIEEKGISD